MQKRVLLVEDDEDDYVLTKEMLSAAFGKDAELTWVQTPDAALQSLAQDAYDVCLIDYRLGSQSGIEVIKQCVGRECAVPFILLTGQGSHEADALCAEVGAAGYLTKGTLNRELLERSIRYAIARQKTINEEMQENKLLSEKNETLFEFYKTATEFVETVSHEFRAPLSVVREFASIMQEGLIGEVNDEQRDYLLTIVDRVDGLSGLVTDLLDISKLEQGTLGIRRQSCAAAKIVRDVFGLLEFKAEKSGITFEVEVAQGMPEAFCDPEKIGRVLINLGVNALKFTKKGGSVRLWARYDVKNKQVVFGVTDDGPGIPPEGLKKIFGRFEQLGGNARNGAQGFGLGLNIARDLVHLNFGDIRVESELGSGSTFSFTVPTCEPISLLKRYGERVGAFRDELTQVSLVRVDVSDPECAANIEDIDQLLYREMRAYDLILRESPDTWWLVITTNDQGVDALMDRISRSIDDTNKDSSGPKLAPAMFSTIGSWRLDNEYANFLTAFKQQSASTMPRLAG